MTFLVLDLLAIANWRNAFSPDHAGSLAATFGPAENRRNVIIALEARSPLIGIGAKEGDQLKFDRASDAYRVLGQDETIGVTLYTPQGPRAYLLHPVQERHVAQQFGAYAAGFLTQGLCALFALVLALMIAMRRPESGAMRALALGLLVDSLDFFTTYLPGSALQNVFNHYLRPALLVPCILGFLYFSLTFPEDRPLWRLQRFRIAFWVAALLMAGVAGALLVDRLSGLSPAGSILAKQARSAVHMGCYVLTLSALYCAWSASAGTTRHRLAWTSACLGVPLLTYFLSNAVILSEVMSDRYLDVYGSIATSVAYVGLGYALLRHRLFNFSFALNRTLVFTVTSLLLFLAFWLIEQVVHKLVHFGAVENNAMLGGAIAFALFFAFNRLHHRVDHWIEHLFFRQWRARESDLRTFMAKAAHFKETGALVAAFGAALDRFTSGGGNVIYLMGGAGCFERVHFSLSTTPEALKMDDDIAVSLRKNRQSMLLPEPHPAFQAQLALPMLQGGELKGIILLATRPDVHGFRPDEQAVLEAAATQIALDLSRLHAAHLAGQLLQIQRDHDLQHQEQLLLQVELDSMKQERATLMLALSKVVAPAWHATEQP
jgi:hypothetical protein